MKKYIFLIIGLFVGVVLGVVLTIKTIQIDGVNELDNGVITIKVFNHYFDYEYITRGEWKNNERTTNTKFFIIN